MHRIQRATFRTHSNKQLWTMMHSNQLWQCSFHGHYNRPSIRHGRISPPLSQCKDRGEAASKISTSNHKIYSKRWNNIINVNMHIVCATLFIVSSEWVCVVFVCLFVCFDFRRHMWQLRAPIHHQPYITYITLSNSIFNACSDMYEDWV